MLDLSHEAAVLAQRYLDWSFNRAWGSSELTIVLAQRYLDWSFAAGELRILRSISLQYFSVFLGRKFNEVAINELVVKFYGNRRKKWLLPWKMLLNNVFYHVRN